MGVLDRTMRTILGSPLGGPSGGGSGETNIAANLGAGEGVFATKVGVELRFKSLVAGTNISLASDANTITINATGGITWSTPVDASITLDTDITYDFGTPSVRLRDIFLEEASITTNNLWPNTWGTPIPGIIINGDSTEALANTVSGIILKSTINNGHYFVIGTQDNNAVGTNGSLFLSSGSNSVGTSGNVEFFTGAAGANSGTLFMISGNATNSSGAAQIQTGLSGSNSGVIELATGPSTGGNSGNVTIQTGSAAAGASGNIRLLIQDGATEGVFRFHKLGAAAPAIGDVWTATSTNGEGYWAAPSGGILWSTPVNANIVPDGDNTRELGTAFIRFSSVNSFQTRAQNTFDLRSGVSATASFKQSQSGPNGLRSPALVSLVTTSAFGILTVNQTGATASQSIFVETGNNTGSGDSGGINLVVGTAVGNQGNFRFHKAGTTVTVGHVWTATSTNGEGYWAAAGGGGANLTLSNLTAPTAINQDLIFNKANPVIKGSADGTTSTILRVQGGSITSGASNGGTVVLEAGNAFSGFAGSITLLGGESLSTGTSGAIAIKGGEAGSTASTGAVELQSGNKWGGTTGNTGPLIIRSGSNAGTLGNSGAFDISTGTAVGGASGNITLNTGNSTSGVSGNITFQTGTGTTRGNIVLNSRFLDVSNTRLANAGYLKGRNGIDSLDYRMIGIDNANVLRVGEYGATSDLSVEANGVISLATAGFIQFQAASVEFNGTVSNNFAIQSGNTGSRPGGPVVGSHYFDTDLGIPIWHNGTNWVDATGATV